MKGSAMTYTPEIGFPRESRDGRRPRSFSACPLGNFSHFYVIRNLLPALLELTCRGLISFEKGI